MRSNAKLKNYLYNTRQEISTEIINKYEEKKLNKDDILYDIEIELLKSNLNIIENVISICEERGKY